MANATDQQRKDLISSYDMLTNPKNMGERFKFFAMLQKQTNDDNYFPAGFKKLS